jgi:hypothetical protein
MDVGLSPRSFGAQRANSDEVAHLLEAFAAVEAEFGWQQTGVPLAHLTDQLDTWCRE